MDLKNFNAIVCTGDISIGNNGFVQYRKQTNIERLRAYFNNKYPRWTFVTIYDRKTNEKQLIKRN